MNISTFCRLILTISWWISIFLCQVPNFVQFAPRRTGWADQSLTGWAGWDWFLEVNASPRKVGPTYRRIEATENGIYLMIYHDLSSKTEVGGQVLNSQWLGIWLGLGAAGLTSTLGWFRQLEANHLFRCSETRDKHGQALLGWMVKCLPKKLLDSRVALVPLSTGMIGMVDVQEVSKGILT